MEVVCCCYYQVQVVHSRVLCEATTPAYTPPSFDIHCSQIRGKIRFRETFPNVIAAEVGYQMFKNNIIQFVTAKSSPFYTRPPVHEVSILITHDFHHGTDRRERGRGLRRVPRERELRRRRGPGGEISPKPIITCTYSSLFTLLNRGETHDRNFNVGDH